MRRAFLVLTVCAGGLWGCGSNPPPAPAPSATPTPKVEAKPDAATAQAAGDQPPPFVYAYVPSGKRDPFRNPIDELVNSANQAALTQTACNQPLCRWDLDQLKLVGVVSGMSNPLAMVEDPQGVGHVVRRNSFVGKKGGRVTQIKHDAVVVTEISRGGDGKPHPVETDLHLAQDAQELSAQDLLQSEGSE